MKLYCKKCPHVNCSRKYHIFCGLTHGHFNYDDYIEYIRNNKKPVIFCIEHKGQPTKRNYLKSNYYNIDFFECNVEENVKKEIEQVEEKKKENNQMSSTKPNEAIKKEPDMPPIDLKRCFGYMKVRNRGFFKVSPIAFDTSVFDF